MFRNDNRFIKNAFSLHITLISRYIVFYIYKLAAVLRKASVVIKAAKFGYSMS